MSSLSAICLVEARFVGVGVSVFQSAQETNVSPKVDDGTAFRGLHLRFLCRPAGVCNTDWLGHPPRFEFSTSNRAMSGVLRWWVGVALDCAALIVAQERLPIDAWSFLSASSAVDMIACRCVCIVE